MVIQKQNEHNGVRHEIYETSTKHEATFGTGNTKSVMVGRVCVERMNGSYKYPDQLQIVMYGNTVREQDRNMSQYDRIEICLPYGEGIELLRTALDKMCGGVPSS
jgi:hypothetical protein